MQEKLIAWLKLVALGHILLGLAVPLLAFSSGFDFYAEQIQRAFWPNTGMPEQVLDYARWMVALFGPTVASWGVLMWYIVRAGAQSSAAWPWNALLLSLLAWAPLDIGISLLHGFASHVLLNLLAIAAIALPCLILRARSTS